jgi:peptide/nickel transport system ATP-binding protein/oligopeptide transport system ATP-binding protein
MNWESSTGMPLLEVKHLRTHIPVIDGIVRAVDGLDFSLGSHESLGIAGESGCGKTMVALSIMGLAPFFTKRILQGQVFFKGKDLLKFDNKELSEIRGNKIAMIFQEPMTSLNPILTIGTQISEIFIRHEGVDQTSAHDKSIEMLGMVSIPSARKTLGQYPHQLSGGMRQRVMIAMALACRPEILIADEPTTALDSTIQAQILELIKDLQNQVGTSIIFITHNLGIIAESTQRVIIMYLGQAVEMGSVFDLFDRPMHPYTQALLNAVPKLGTRSKEGKKRLEEIMGSVPNPVSMPSGCRFHPRCPKRNRKCEEHEPELWEAGSGHLVRCWL